MKFPFLKRKEDAIDFRNPHQQAEIAAAVANSLIRFIDRNINDISGVDDGGMTYGQGLALVAESLILSLATLDSFMREGLSYNERNARVAVLQQAMNREVIRYGEFGKVSQQALADFGPFFDRLATARLEMYAKSGEWVTDATIEFGKIVRARLDECKVEYTPLNSTFAGHMIIEGTVTLMKSGFDSVIKP